MRTLFLAAFLLSFAARAGDELTPEKMGQIDHEQQKASDEIDKKHGGKKPSEMSQDERREIIREKAAAEQAVLDKHGVDKKDYTRASAKMGRDDYAAAKSASKALEKKEADAQKAGGGQKEIVIERGNGGNEVSDVNEAQEADRAAGLGAGAGDSSPQKSKKKRR